MLGSKNHAVHTDTFPTDVPFGEFSSILNLYVVLPNFGSLSLRSSMSISSAEFALKLPSAASAIIFETNKL